jgi:hypothetical protein
MRTATDCTRRAEQCRELAKSAAKPEDWTHFLEMAQTWELLAKQRQNEESELAKTLALAESIANPRPPKSEPVALHNHEEAA